MIWHGYTGAAGWMFRQALEGVLGLRLRGGEVVPGGDPAGEPRLLRVSRDVSTSPLRGGSHDAGREEIHRERRTATTGGPR
jgi:cyclic beta-1,2-glucan synthetase